MSCRETIMCSAPGMIAGMFLRFGGCHSGVLAETKKKYCY